jgi:uncharacterized damage-inducible protein DinB
MATILVKEFLRSLEEEALPSRKCLERIPETLFSWKPHEKSMPMGYLAVLVSDIPRWITATVKDGDIDFATWKQFNPKTTAELVAHLDETMKDVRVALTEASDEDLQKPFRLRRGEQIFMTSSRLESISSSIRLLCHHRGQLSVYMRLNNIPVPSLYGPSADEKTF